VVAATQARASARRDLGRLAHRGLDVPEYVRAVRRILRRAVPCEGTCVLTIDPATLLPTSEICEYGLPPEVRDRLTEIELRERDFNKFTGLARGTRRAASLSEATQGELDLSLRQRELRRPSGFADELRAVLPASRGDLVARPFFDHYRPRLTAARSMGGDGSRPPAAGRSTTRSTAVRPERRDADSDRDSGFTR